MYSEVSRLSWKSDFASPSSYSWNFSTTGGTFYCVSCSTGGDRTTTSKVDDASLSGYFYADNEFLLSAKLQTPFTFMRDAKLDSTGEKQVVQDDRRIKFSEEMQ